MRGLVGLMIGAGMVVAAPSVWAQRYDPAYQFCMEVAEENGTRIDCLFTSMDQCKQAAKGMPGSCMNNPFYKPPPAEATPVAEPAPAPPPTPVKKKKKAAVPTQPPPAAPAAR
jgi:hypothetical protein